MGAASTQLKAVFWWTQPLLCSQDFVPKPQISWCMELASRDKCQWGIIAWGVIHKPSLFANPHFNTVGLSINGLGPILLIINLIKPLIFFKDFLEASVREYCLKHCLYPLFIPWGGGTTFPFMLQWKLNYIQLKPMAIPARGWGSRGIMHWSQCSPWLLEALSPAIPHFKKCYSYGNYVNLMF